MLVANNPDCSTLGCIDWVYSLGTPLNYFNLSGCCCHHRKLSAVSWLLEMFLASPMNIQLYFWRVPSVTDLAFPNIIRVKKQHMLVATRLFEEFFLADGTLLVSLMEVYLSNMALQYVAVVEYLRTDITNICTNHGCNLPTLRQRLLCWSLEADRYPLLKEDSLFRSQNRTATICG